jgi:hypothetical protein
LPKQIVKSFWSSFDKEMEPFMAELDGRNNDVESEIRLVKAQADRQYQILQVKEQELANMRLKDFMVWARRQGEEIKTMRVHREKLEEGQWAIS